MAHIPRRILSIIIEKSTTRSHPTPFLLPLLFLLLLRIESLNNWIHRRQVGAMISGSFDTNINYYHYYHYYYYYYYHRHLPPPLVFLVAVQLSAVGSLLLSHFCLSNMQMTAGPTHPSPLLFCFFPPVTAPPVPSIGNRQNFPIESSPGADLGASWRRKGANRGCGGGWR